jgi:hypothetical protein
MRQAQATRRHAASQRRTGVQPTPYAAAATQTSRRRRPGHQTNGLQATGRRWPRLALLGVVLAVAFGVLAMHDLTQPMASSHVMGSTELFATGEPAAPFGAKTMTRAAVADAATVQLGSPTTHSDGVGGCASCGHHPSAMALCVLTLGLLLLVWRLPRLRTRMAPPSAAFCAPSWVPVPHEPRKPSLAELMVCRT